MRPLPSDIYTEKALLGCILLNEKCKPIVKNIITSSDFYSENNGLLYDTIIENESDIVVIQSALKKKGILDQVGGIDYMAQLIEHVATSAPAEQYAKSIKELSIRRSMIAASNELSIICSDPASDLKCIISNHKAKLRALESTQQEDYTNSQTLLQRVYKNIEERSQSDDHNVGILSGYIDIDMYMQGFEPKTLTYIAARPSIGKTALAINIAENMAKIPGENVLFFSLEMGSEQITRRRLAAESDVYLSRIRSGSIEGHQWEYLVKALDRLSSRKFNIVDHPRYKTIETLTSMAETMALENKLSIVFVDHIQLMRSLSKFNSRHLEISHISNELKSLAKRLNIPVVGLCQLNRNIENRKNGRPMLSDLKESGDLEQDCDNALGLYRETKKVAKLEVGGMKGRDVGTWKTELYYEPLTQKITDAPDQQSIYI